MIKSTVTKGIIFILILGIFVLPVNAKTDNIVTGAYKINFDLSGTPGIGDYSVKVQPQDVFDVGPSESDRADASTAVNNAITITNSTKAAFLSVMEAYDVPPNMDYNESLYQYLMSVCDNVVSAHGTIDGHHAAIFFCAVIDSDGTTNNTVWATYRLKTGSPVINVVFNVPYAWFGSFMKTLHVEKVDNSSAGNSSLTNNEFNASEALLQLLPKSEPDNLEPMSDMFSDDTGIYIYKLYWNGTIVCDTTNLGENFVPVSWNTVPVTVIRDFTRDAGHFWKSEKPVQKPEVSLNQFVKIVLNSWGGRMVYAVNNNTFILHGTPFGDNSNETLAKLIKDDAEIENYRGTIPNSYVIQPKRRIQG